MNALKSLKQYHFYEILNALILALVVFRIGSISHFHKFPEYVQVAQGIVDGTPVYKVIQSRILGPYLVELISSVGISFQLSYALVTFFVLLLFNVAAYFCFFSMCRDRSRSLFSVLLCDMLFVVFQSTDWVLIFDYLELPIGLFFAYGVFTGQGILFCSLLFACAIFNREMALCIPLWLILDSLKMPWDKQGLIPNSVQIQVFDRVRYKFIEDKLKLAVGLLLMAGGMVVTALLRSFLFIHPPIDSKDLVDSATNLMQLKTNLMLLFKIIWLHDLNPKNLLSMEPFYGIAVLLPCLFFIYLFRKIPEMDVRERKACVLFFLMAGIIFLFGYLIEIREWIILIPFIVMFYMDLHKTERVELCVS